MVTKLNHCDRRNSPLLHSCVFSQCPVHIDASVTWY